MKEQAQKQSQSKTEASSHQTRFTPPTSRNQTDSTLTRAATETSTAAPAANATTRSPFDFSQTPIHPAPAERTGDAPRTTEQHGRETKAAKPEDASNVKEAVEKESTQPKEKESTQPKRHLRSKLLKGSNSLESAYNGNLLIGPGTKGDGVAKIQKALNLIYQHDKTFVPLDETGDFNALTTAAFSRFQKDNALKRGTNGIVGTETLEKLDELLNAPPPKSAYTWLPPSLSSNASAPLAAPTYLTTPLGAAETAKKKTEQKKPKQTIADATGKSRVPTKSHTSTKTNAPAKTNTTTTSASDYIWQPFVVGLLAEAPTAAPTYLTAHLTPPKPAQQIPDKEKIKKSIAQTQTYEQQGAWEQTLNTAFLSSILEMSDMDMATLSLHTERLKMIERILQFSYVDSDAETALIGLLRSAPSSDVPALFKALQADKNRLLKRLENKIQGANYHDYHLVLRELMLQSYDPFQSSLQMETLHEEASPLTLPWSDPGFLKAFTTKKIVYSAKLIDTGEIRISWSHMDISGSPYGVVNSLDLDPFQMIGLRLLSDEAHLGGVGAQGRVYVMPAINMLNMSNKQLNQAIGEFFDAASVVTGIGEVAYGTKLLRAVLGAADIAYGSGNLFISSNRFEIAKSEGGRSFLSYWDITGKLMAVYGLGRLAIEAPQAISKLSNAWKNFKPTAPATISQTGINKIDQMIVSFDSVVHQAEMESHAQKLLPDPTEITPTAIKKSLSEEKLATSEELLAAAQRQDNKTIVTKELERVDETNVSADKSPHDSEIKSEADKELSKTIDEASQINPALVTEGKLFTPEELLAVTWQDQRLIDEFVAEHLGDLLRPENYEAIWGLAGSPRGKIIEPIKGLTEYKKYLNLNTVKYNFNDVDFDLMTVAINEVRSVKTFHPYVNFTMQNFKTTLRKWMNKLDQKDLKDFVTPNGILLDLSNREKVLAFIVKKGVWDMAEVKLVEDAFNAEFKGRVRAIISEW